MHNIMATFFWLFFVMNIACGYELIEWYFAISVSGDIGIEFILNKKTYDEIEEELLDNIDLLLIDFTKQYEEDNE